MAMFCLFCFRLLGPRAGVTPHGGFYLVLRRPAENLTRLGKKFWRGAETLVGTTKYTKGADVTKGIRITAQVKPIQVSKVFRPLFCVFHVVCGPPQPQF